MSVSHENNNKCYRKAGARTTYDEGNEAYGLPLLSVTEMGEFKKRSCGCCDVDDDMAKIQPIKGKINEIKRKNVNDHNSGNQKQVTNEVVKTRHTNLHMSIKNSYEWETRFYFFASDT